jgi:hypothetical protein
MLEKNPQKFASVKEASKIHPSFSEPSLRYLIFNAQKNGLKKCLIKIGKKVLIDLSEFEAWIKAHSLEGK